MPWRYLYRTDDGTLLSETDAAIDPVPAGCAVAVFDERQSGLDWDPARLLFRPPAPGPALVLPVEIIKQMTPDEWAAAKALSDVRVQWFRDRIMASVEPIDARGLSFTQGVQLLVALGIFAPQRAADYSAAVIAQAR